MSSRKRDFRPFRPWCLGSKGEVCVLFALDFGLHQRGDFSLNVADLSLDRTDHQVHADDVAPAWLAAETSQAIDKLTDRDDATVVWIQDVREGNVVLWVDVQVVERGRGLWIPRHRVDDLPGDIQGIDLFDGLRQSS